MVQETQSTQQAVSGVTRQPARTAAPLPDLLTRVPAAVNTRAPEQSPALADVDATDPGSAKVETVARSRNLRAELVRTETVLQIAEEAYAAIEAAYNGIGELAGLSKTGDLTPNERATLDAAIELLRRHIGDTVNAAEFEGEPILRGGDGPDGAHLVARFFTEGIAGFADPFDILIPAFELHFHADAPPPDEPPAEDIALPSPAPANPPTAFFARVADTIASQRATLQQIYAVEVDPAQTLSQQIEPTASLANARALSRSISAIVLTATAVPFQTNAEKMRGILNHASQGAPPVFSSMATAASTRETANLIFATVGPTPIRHATDNAPGPTPTGSEGDTVTQADTGVFFGSAQPTANAAPRDAIPGKIEPAPITLLAETDTTAQPTTLPLDRGLPHISPSVEPPGPVAAPVALAAIVPDAPELALSTTPYAGGSIRAVPIAPPPSPVPSVLVTTTSVNAGNPVQATPVRRDAPERETSEGTPGDVFVAAAEDPFQLRHQSTSDSRLPEAMRAVENDAARRAPGAVQPSRDADLRLDAGLAAARPGADHTTGLVDGFGPSLPAEPGSFLAELVRADTMLHTADQAIEQIDLHVDFLRDLAEESVSDTSRNRLSLDDIFQAVKSDIIDGLAQATEAQGEKILGGGNGPDGAYVIGLNGDAAVADLPDLAVPSMRLDRLAPALVADRIGTPAEAAAALGRIESASDDILQIRDTIADQRSLLRHLISQEIARSGGRQTIA